MGGCDYCGSGGMEGGRWEDVTIVEVVGWREGDGRM